MLGFCVGYGDFVVWYFFGYCDWFGGEGEWGLI